MTRSDLDNVGFNDSGSLHRLQTPNSTFGTRQFPLQGTQNIIAGSLTGGTKLSFPQTAWPLPHPKYRCIGSRVCRPLRVELSADGPRHLSWCWSTAFTGRTDLGMSRPRLSFPVSLKPDKPAKMDLRASFLLVLGTVPASSQGRTAT
ncbi:hypothetical protein VTK26DRAFT_2480 [Humicola hyalothermophila]